MEYTISTIAPIVLLPFLAFILSALVVKKSDNLAVGIAISGILGSWVFSARVFYDFVFGVYSKGYYIHKFFNWFTLTGNSHDFVVNMGVYIDNMTAILLFMVTTVGSMILIFSTYYMKGDKFGFGRFFVYMILFSTGMIGLTLSDNLLSVFMFWELMGFCSYSLIGFYYQKESAAQACVKAFMTTRIGDVFFLLAIVAIWSVVGSVTFVDIYAALSNGAFDGMTLFGYPLLTFIAIFIFMGTIGKSAQFPLQVWLPDAMQGPTPCSAMIHAATMVAAGVYLALRVYPILEAGHLLTFVAYIGGITALGAATIALVQTDIKAVLAYSTISQLGYMVLGVGVGAYNAAFMHLITHAVFKACLFLSSGSVIHALHDHHTHQHVQEMPRMGGLRHKMPLTFLAMLLCSFAIAGFPFFSGFVSKDRILGDALVMATHHGAYIPVAILGYAAAFLTAFYMFRMIFLTFFGEPRDKELYDHTPKETLLWNRNVPLLFLSIFTLGVFYSGSFTGQGIVKVAGDRYEWFSTLVEKPHLEHFKHYQKSLFSFEDDINRDFERSHYDPSHGMSDEEAHHVHHTHLIGAVMSIFIALGGFLLAYFMYFKKSIQPWAQRFSGYTRTLQNKYYFDDLYIKGVIQKGLLPLNRFLAWIDMGIYDRFFVDGTEKVVRLFWKVSGWTDRIIVDALFVDGTGASVRFFNVILRTLQSGKIQFYFLIAFIVLASYIVTLL
jgi:NADH-quinone oxidoreductase subunit L